jgi:response regulator RpfG family c-di-GMP phosphodiesterase
LGDEEDIVTLFTDVVRMNSYLILEITNPLFFINYISEYSDPIQLILLDYRMPQLSGCQLADRLYSINPNKIVLITAFYDIVNNTLNLENIKKPITLPKIIETIKHNLRYTIINLRFSIMTFFSCRS